MANVSPPVRDMPLIVEVLLIQAVDLHCSGAPAAEVDECLAEAKALLAGEQPVLPLERDHGQA